MSTPLIHLDNVCFSYHEEEVLCSVSLEIQKGEFVGIIGPNGSGKTTLIKVILGLIKPDNGTVKLFGKPIESFNNFAKIGYVGQKATQINTTIPTTVKEIVALGRLSLRPLGTLSDDKDEKAIQKALKNVGLSDKQHALITELSGGQQQRVFIAKALASEPELLILDEPTTGVDVNAQDDFYKLLADLNKQGITLIIVSHDIDVIVNEVNKLVCLNKKLVYHGTPKQFIKEDYLEKLYGKNRKFIIHGH
jgi:zinc transport system ATP-binding protein